jgi:hypothetical protein
MNYVGIVHVDRNVEGVVEMMLDASQRYDMTLTMNEFLDGMQLYFQLVGVECSGLTQAVTVMEKCK